MDVLGREEGRRRAAPQPRGTLQSHKAWARRAEQAAHWRWKKQALRHHTMTLMSGAAGKKLKGSRSQSATCDARSICSDEQQPQK